MSTPSKYRDVNKNGCPTGWKYGVEKWSFVCKEIYTTEMMRLMASFWGSLILAIFLVGGTASYNTYTASAGDLMYAPMAWFTIPIVHGFGLFVVAATVFAIAGTGNPALTLVQGFAGMISYMDVVWYLIGSTLGWVIGSAILLIWVTPGTLLASVPTVQPDVGLGAAFGVEIFASFVWGITLFLNVGKPDQNYAAGLGLTCAMWVAWPFTRGALNPHRVLGPAIALLFTGDTSLWTVDITVYIFAHIIGFGAAYGVHYVSFASMQDERAKKACQSQERACLPAGQPQSAYA